MRGNGLTADDYAPLAEMERSVAADALLALREAGVAAYAVVPEPEDTPGSGEGSGSGAPAQVSVFADRTALERARAVVRDLAPDALPAAEAAAVDEVAWQQIVSGFSATAPDPEHGTPATPAPRSADRGDDPPAPPREPHPLVRDDEDHFVPEPPGPPPHLDRLGRLAWGGLFGGPLLLLAAMLLSWNPPRWLALLCVVGFVGGMVILVLRMKDRPPPDDGPDDGAVL
jgi:hypothetical protein